MKRKHIQPLRKVLTPQISSPLQLQYPAAREVQGALLADCRVHCRVPCRWQSALSLLSVAREAILQPDTICFNSAISACGKSSKWQHAVDLLAKMWQEQCPDKITYNAILAALSKGALWQSAIAILEDLQAHHTADIASFGTAVTSCVPEGEWQRVLELLRDMRRLTLHNIWTLNEAIACFAKAWSCDYCYYCSYCYSYDYCYCY